MSFWEHVLLGEERRRPLEDLHFYLGDPELAAQLDQLGPVAGGHSLSASLVDVGDVHPTAQARLGDPEVRGQVADRLGPLTRQLDGASAELRRMWTGHADSLPRGLR